MGIVSALILSIIIKGVSAIVEIAIQMLITNTSGVTGYGEYSFYVSLIEAAYFVLFSGSIKLNTFYLSNPNADIKKFKNKYQLFFVAPIITVLLIIFIILQKPLGILSSIILFIYYLAFDKSSVFFSRGKQLQALLGEYLIGRIIMLIGILTLIKLETIDSFILLLLYGIQFVAAYLWFIANKNKIKKGKNDKPVSIRKLAEYQKSDIATSLVTYSPTILQYIVGGAFTAGFTGIISIIKKFINFISGPTAKVFLPEFSRLYRKNDKQGLQKSYMMIVKVQMVFIATIATILVVFPDIILNLFSKELLPYANLFTFVALSLLIIAGMGPVTGLLQMTGNERKCTINQWISIASMVITWIIFRQTPMFAVYGLCVQAIVEGILKYVSVCKWFNKAVIPIKTYIIFWLPVLIEKCIISMIAAQSSYIALVVCVVITLIWNTAITTKDPMVNKAIMNFKERIKKGLKNDHNKNTF